MNPMLLPKTKSPLRLPVCTNWSASSLVKQPELRRRSTKETAMQPSTFRIRLGFFEVVIFSTSSA